MSGELDSNRGGTKVVAVSGLLLDRAWPELGVEGGRQRRKDCFDALIELVRRAREADADVLVVLGDLFDRRCVTPKTIREIGNAFEAFKRRVLVVPGSADWLGHDNPYTTEDWPASTHIFRSSEPSPCKLPSGTTFWAAAQTTPTPHASNFDALVRDYTCPEGRHVALLHDPGRPLPPGFSHVIARTNPGFEGRDVTATGVAVQDAIGGHDPSQAVFVELNADGTLASRETFELGVPSLRPNVLDASELSATSEWAQRDAPLPLRLTGTLPRGVLLPPAADAGPDGAGLDTGSLEYELPAPESSDQTAEAEFERTILQGQGSTEERHQAIALGLRALSQARHEPAGAEPGVGG